MLPFANAFCKIHLIYWITLVCVCVCVCVCVPVKYILPAFWQFRFLKSINHFFFRIRVTWTNIVPRGKFSFSAPSVWMYLCTRVCVCDYACMCAYVYMSLYVGLWVYMYVFVDVCVCIISDSRIKNSEWSCIDSFTESNWKLKENSSILTEMWYIFHVGIVAEGQLFIIIIFFFTKTSVFCSRTFW